MALSTSARKPFQRQHYVVRSVVEFTLIGVVLGVAFRQGFLDGYFVQLPLVVLFYALMGLGAGEISRRVLRSTSVRVQSLLLMVSMGRLLLAVGATALGLWLLPSYRWSFVVLSAVSYLEAVRVSLIPVLRS